MVIEHKNTACQSFATQEQAVFEIIGGANCPVSETILSKNTENATSDLKPKIRNSFDFSNELERKAYVLLNKIFHRKKLLSTLVINNNFKYYNIPNWEKLNKIDKLFCICVFIINKKEFMTFTLRFSKEFMMRACKSKKDLTSYIADRISQNFKNHKGRVPKYMFAVEKDKDDDSFHIHGIIEANHDNLDKIKHILKTTALGVNYKQSSINRFALRFAYMPNPLGWLRYMTEDKQFGYNMIYVNRVITQELNSFYNSVKYLN